MMKNKTLRKRLLAAVCFLIGLAFFAGGQPSRLSDERIAAAKEEYAAWKERYNADLLRGRQPNAGPAPSTDTHTRGEPVLITLGFALCLIGSLTLVLSFM